MKVTLEPSDPACQDMYPTVTISSQSDDLSLVDAFELVKMALIAWGYSATVLEDMEIPND